MEMERNAYRAHCLVLTFPIQGHINPMLEFSKRLEHKGVKVTLVTTYFISNAIHKEATSIALETISDGYDEGGIAQAESVRDYLERFERVESQTLAELLEKLSSSSRHVDCIVYDAFLPWALDIAKKFGLIGTALFTQSCAVNNIYYHVHKGVLKNYGFDIFKPNTDSCMKWLDDQPKGSVVYVSFGSIAVLEVEQMEEIAWGLRLSNRCFLWVVRASEEVKLPKNFVEETCEKGLVVCWCSQLEVLTHEAVGCFVTHCGWNSTLEALSFSVPMVAVPLWLDQITNAKYIMDIWKMALKPSVDEKGLVKREALKHCIREIMEGERGKEIKKNAFKWRKLAKEAVDEGGSSDKNMEEFVGKLVHSYA